MIINYFLEQCLGEGGPPLSLQPCVSCQSLKGWGPEERLHQAPLGLAWRGAGGGEGSGAELGPPGCGKRGGPGTAWRAHWQKRNKAHTSTWVSEMSAVEKAPPRVARTFVFSKGGKRGERPLSEQRLRRLSCGLNPFSGK